MNEPKGIVHGGEYVMSKAAVQRIGVGNLDAMHQAAKAGAPVAASAPAAAAPVSIKQVNVWDPAEAMEAGLKTEAGQQVLINWMSRNRRSVSSALGK